MFVHPDDGFDTTIVGSYNCWVLFAVSRYLIFAYNIYIYMYIHIHVCVATWFSTLERDGDPT